MAHTTDDQRVLALIFDLGEVAYSERDGDWYHLVPDQEDAPIGIMIKIRRTESLDSHGPRYTYQIVGHGSYNR